jgi:hypothetical protein
MMKKIFLAGIATASLLAAIPAMAQQSSQSQQPQQPSARAEQRLGEPIPS